MKYILLVFMFTGLFFVTACPDAKNSAAELNNNSASADGQSVIARQSNSMIITLAPTPTTTPLPKLEFIPKEPMVWVSQISANDSTGEIDDKFSLSNGEIDHSKKYSQIGLITEVDIFNCAGYLMSGRAQKDGNFGWEFELMPETVAPDIIQKMKQCDNFSEEERKKENLLIGNQVFAVAPTDKSRRNVKSINLKGTGIFAKLPHDIQKMLDDTRFNKDFIRRQKKGEISVENADLLADIDGDGEVDLISFGTICSEDDDPEGDGCDFIFMKIKGKWKQIGYMSKA